MREFFFRILLGMVGNKFRLKGYPASFHLTEIESPSSKGCVTRRKGRRKNNRFILTNEVCIHIQGKGKRGKVSGGGE